MSFEMFLTILDICLLTEREMGPIVEPDRI